MSNGAILILGVPRTGTSLISELFHRSSQVYAGSSFELEQADSLNTRGYWEYLPLKDIHNRIVTEGCNTTVFIPPSSQQLHKLAQQPVWNKEAQELIHSMNAGASLASNPLWFWKHPWLTFLLPFWQEMNMPKTGYVVCFRNPMSAALSQKNYFEKRILKTDTPVSGFPLSGAFLLWQVYMISALRHIEGNPKIFIEYENAIDKPLKAYEKIQTFLLETFEVEGDLANMDGVVQPTLQHYQHSDFTLVAEATNVQKHLYTLLKELADNPNRTINFEDIALPNDWQEQLMTLQSWYAQYMRPTVID